MNKIRKKIIIRNRKDNNYIRTGGVYQYNKIKT